MAKVTKDGVTISEPFALETAWSYKVSNTVCWIIVAHFWSENIKNEAQPRPVKTHLMPVWERLQVYNQDQKVPDILTVNPLVCNDTI